MRLLNDLDGTCEKQPLYILSDSSKTYFIAGFVHNLSSCQSLTSPSSRSGRLTHLQAELMDRGTD